MIEQYKLKSEYVPFGYEKERGLSEQDKKIGGIRVVYNVTSTNFVKTVPTKSTRIFLKVFKQFWEDSKDKCKSKNEWGSPLVNVSNVWIELFEDYEDINNEDFIYNTRVVDPELIGMLNRREDSFTISILNTAVNIEPKSNPFKKRTQKIFRWFGIAYVLISTNIKSKFSHDNKRNEKLIGH